MTNDRSPCYPASLIAHALGIEPRNSTAIYRELQGVPAAATVRARGSAATRLYSPAAIELHAFPIFKRLTALASRAGCRDAAHFLATKREGKLQPRTLDGLSDARRAEIRLRRDVLAPILARAGGRDSLAEMARRGGDDFARMAGETRDPRTVKRWLTRAIERDLNRHEWEREGLYADKPDLDAHEAAGQRPTRLAAPSSPLQLDELDAALLDGQLSKQRPSVALRGLWRVACVQMELMLADGHEESAALGAVVARLMAADSPARWSSHESGAVVMRRKWRQWCDAGRATGFTDRRETNAGKAPKFTLTDTEARALRGLVLKKQSFPVAIEWFAKSRACGHETRELILAELDRAARLRSEPHWPDSIRRAGRPTADEEAAFRGEKAFQAVEFSERRGAFYIDADGNRLPTRPNTVWESDDMSSNAPFTWIEHGADGAEILRIGRQTLCTLDVHSGMWLGVHAIGRERDAYRAEDIADHMAAMIERHGLPDIWRLERGRWENTFIDGVLLGRDADGKEIRWGGLDALFHIERAFKSKQKGTVENGFNFLQTLLSHEGADIGRTRGEFERQSKAFLRAGNGDRAAWEKFWPMAECGDAFALAMERANNRPRNRRAHGRALVVASELYRSAIRHDLPDAERWRLLPEKRSATMRHGHVECTVRHYPFPFRFRVNGSTNDFHLEHGYPVLIAFHPGHPEEGCHIFNAERGPRNREGYKFGELLTKAPLADDAPQVNLAPHERAFHARRDANAKVRNELRTLGVLPGSTQSGRTSRDGWGQSVSVGTPRPAGSTPPREAGRRAAADDAAALFEQARQLNAKEPPPPDLEKLNRAEAELMRDMGLSVD